MVRTIRARFAHGVFEPLEPTAAAMVALERNIYADRIVTTRPGVTL